MRGSLDESLQLLDVCSYFLGANFSSVPPAKRKSTDVGVTDKNLAPSLIDRVHDLNKLDSQLYAYAVERFNDLMKDVNHRRCPIRYSTTDTDKECWICH